MTHNLTDKQKALLTWFVQQVREGKMTEEFQLSWGQERLITSSDGSDIRVKWEEMPITSVALDALKEEGVLISIPQYDDRNQEHERHCCLTRKAFILVDAGFQTDEEHPILPSEIRHASEILRQRVPLCDEVILAYLEEAIKCAEISAFLATSVMLGAASEKAILLLIQVFMENITTEKAKKRFVNRMNKSRDISWKFKIFQESYNGCKSKPDKRVYTEGFKTAIEQTYEFCRMTRNKVGHPHILPDLEPYSILANLGYFTTYIERIYELIEYFKTYKVEL